MTAYLCRLILTGFLGFFLMAAMPTAYAANDDLDEFQEKLGNEWVIVKNDKRRGIKTWAKQEDGKRYRSFKVEAIINSKAETGARVLLDFDNHTKWYFETFESKLLKQVSPTEYYYYLKHRAPVSQPYRDVVLHAVVTLQKKPTDPIILTIKAAPDYIPEQPPLVRMIAEDLVAYFTPLPNNQFKLTAEGYVDPGGKVPTWAANYVQRNGPYSILLGLLRMTTSDVYINSKTPLPFKVYNHPDDKE